MPFSFQAQDELSKSLDTERLIDGNGCRRLLPQLLMHCETVNREIFPPTARHEHLCSELQSCARLAKSAQYASRHLARREIQSILGKLDNYPTAAGPGAFRERVIALAEDAASAW